MATKDSGKAIAAVTKLLKTHMLNRLQDIVFANGIPDITVGRPEPNNLGAPTPTPSPRLNLFLYEIAFDPFMKNVRLVDGANPPLWLIIKYLLTAFDSAGQSDTEEAHEYLGEAMRILHGLHLLPLSNPPPPPLSDNPETLKVTFDNITSEFLGKLMQGSDEKFRCSIGLEIRPIMIVSAEVPAYSLLVGVDYTHDPVDQRDDKGIKLEISPTTEYPNITKVIPAKFEIGVSISISGNNFHLSNLSVYLDSFNLPSFLEKGSLRCTIDPLVINGHVISAGNHILSVVKKLDNGRQRTSNLVVGSLLPQLIEAKPTSLSMILINGKQIIIGNIEVKGRLLGTKNDDIVIGLYNQGKTRYVLPTIKIEDSPGEEPQKQITVKIEKKDDVNKGTYRLIYTVNGIQAMNSPEVSLTL